MDQTTSTHEEPDDLVSMLEVIESQPLETRAVAYESLHGSLARRLESGPQASAPS